MDLLIFLAVYEPLIKYNLLVILRFISSFSIFLYLFEYLFADWQHIYFSGRCDRVFFSCTVCTGPCNTKQICSDTSHTPQQPETRNNKKDKSLWNLINLILSHKIKLCMPYMFLSLSFYLYPWLLLVQANSLFLCSIFPLFVASECLWDSIISFWVDLCLSGALKLSPERFLWNFIKL